ncbi:homoserine dehydrogenase [Cesiribacter andamanensis]|uniref:homoserine dehydrogenase n=1 Tax=Cesiribacter andamanensis TaxID=649507 RepID=UPI000348CF6E|nr:homoserine dehydrogenase [Cesiribacter andamanensis]
MKIGLFGFGTVGQGFYQILQEQQLPLEVHRICVRNPHKERPAPQELLTCEARDILEDPEIDLVVEAISETEPAFSIVRESLLRWLPVVSASKKMLALHLPELLALQQETSTPLRYEGAVGGAIPILHLLDEPLRHEPVLSLRAILNGTSNYILSQMRQQGWSYAHALQEAQRLGFAEADPAADVEGYDPCYKLSLLALHAFGTALAPADITRTGITGISAGQIREAEAQGRRIKLIARLQRDAGGSLQASVGPEWLEPDDALWGIEQELNGVEVALKYSGPQLFTGRGAGARPTGTAVLSDVLKLMEGRAYAYPKQEKRHPIVVA